MGQDGMRAGTCLQIDVRPVGQTVGSDSTGHEQSLDYSSAIEGVSYLNKKSYNRKVNLLSSTSCWLNLLFCWLNLLSTKLLIPEPAVLLAEPAVDQTLDT